MPRKPCVALLLDYFLFIVKARPDILNLFPDLGLALKLQILTLQKKKKCHVKLRRPLCFIQLLYLSIISSK